MDNLNLDDINNLLRLKTPPSTTARAGWYIDTIALGKACKLLDIEYPVKIRFTTARVHTGTHRLHVDEDGYYHRILVEQNNNTTIANITIWHELEHAAQQERIAREDPQHRLDLFSKLYKRLENIYGYHNNPFEIEAEKRAMEMHKAHPIIKMRK